MRIASIIVLLLLLIPLANATERTGEGPEARELTGRVVDEAGEPVSGADVFILDREKHRRAKSGKNGEFSIPFSVKQWDSLESPLIVQAGSGSRVGGAAVEAALDETIAPVTIVLKETRPLLVRACDEDGNAIADAVVHLMYLESTASGMPYIERGRTNAEGNWATKALPKVVYWKVFALKPGKGIHGLAVPMEEFARGKVRTLPNEISLVLGDARTLRVKTVDADGKPIPNASVVPFRIELSAEMDALLAPDADMFPKTAEDGVAVLDWVPANMTTMTLFAQSPATQTMPRTVYIDARTVPDEIKIQLDSAAESSGSASINQPSPPRFAKQLAYRLARNDAGAFDKQIMRIVDKSRQMYTRPLILITEKNDPRAIELLRVLDEPNRPNNANETLHQEELRSFPEILWNYEFEIFSPAHHGVREFARANHLEIGNGVPPVLLTLDGAGRIHQRLELDLARRPVVAARPGQAVKTSTSDDVQLVRDFLERSMLPKRDAEKLLSNALTEAKAENKRVLLVCSASWCGPCQLLADFLALYQTETDKHFATVKLDVSRDKGAMEIQERYQGNRPGGVPWYVVLDSKGNELISSNRPMEAEGDEVATSGGNNIGYPAFKEESQEHFFKMLSRAAPNLDREVLQKMRADLAK